MYSDKLKTRTGEKSIVVVLGMHRSGTSAITRALQVLDIDLGERLMLPAENNNEKGFFEDIDVNAINIELLNELGKDWHTLSLIQADELLHEKYAGLRLRAAELLRSRLQNTDRFGLKDPPAILAKSFRASATRCVVCHSGQESAQRGQIPGSKESASP